MTPDAALLSTVITGLVALLPVAASALRRSGLLGTVERLRRERAAVQIVREQVRMATLPLPPGTELSHSVENGLRLVVRPEGQDDNEVTG
ncbi:hypothetical protein [Actinokineospora globicatena]|uniref:hypothetical protein n=1 Tax=Actinokineospora globicatena TaxID=103729 RepID=UPI0020A4FE91|nr:hypothetical protein [Actinokineospora globicatena]MCP2302415.1 hypothetical protein [Actinokineospora globicatena]GLW75905.1 hypothetical protein Aglo01_03870 [Actinokineospora globicatena]GLW82743.1 hypothetical protein Aglo02_03840 [Actinokineospora globicatena]